MTLIPLSLTILSLAGALFSLAVLTYIDLKIRLLPNTYVLAFAIFGLAFHLSTGLRFTSPIDMALGVLVGGGLLYSVRFFSNRLYQQDTLGLGDVKLMMAAGIWLGGHDILSAIIIGAGAGIVHGLIIALIEWRKTKKPVRMSHLALPAGPGFIIGIIAAGMIKFFL